ncbi:hypothetical protein [Corynebacterium yonathiae]|uniref:Uncharacterized protein n=1 Tax=Corynebacterium yonathiae TaxID=2913504 RepID=A0ABU8Y2C4_9CORY|nr:hypothetical protein [uncultured Corynebacterium sp.]
MIAVSFAFDLSLFSTLESIILSTLESMGIKKIRRDGDGQSIGD